MNLPSQDNNCNKRCANVLVWNCGLTFSTGHEIEVVYHSDGTYSLTVGGSGFLSSAHLVKDKESYIIHGNLGDSFFTANVAIIDRTMYIFCGDHNYTVTLPLPEFFDDLGAKQVGGAKTPPYSSRVTKVSSQHVNKS